jgi:hypothetical protein
MSLKGQTVNRVGGSKRGLLVAVVLNLCCLCLPTLACLLSPPAALQRPYGNPPATLQDSDLVGTWEATYRQLVRAIGADRLVLRTDGTFQQHYQAYDDPSYVYETPWNPWWLERFADGRVRLHLKGGRYYERGYDVFQPLYDPIANDSVPMVGELVLNVRSDRRGQLILLHMLYSADEGYALIGGGSQEFRRVKTP